MGNGGLKRRLGPRPRGVGMYPLKIQGGGRELVDLGLRDTVKRRDAQLLTHVLFEFGKAANEERIHKKS